MIGSILSSQLSSSSSPSEHESSVVDQSTSSEHELSVVDRSASSEHESSVMGDWSTLVTGEGEG